MKDSEVPPLFISGQRANSSERSSTKPASERIQYEMDSTKLQLLADTFADGQGVEPLELVLPHPRAPRHTRTPSVPVYTLNNNISDNSSEEWPDNKKEKSKGKGNAIFISDRPVAGGRPRGRPSKVSGSTSRPPPSNRGFDPEDKKRVEIPKASDRARGRPPGRGHSRSNPTIRMASGRAPNSELVPVAGPGEEREEASGSRQSMEQEENVVLTLNLADKTLRRSSLTHTSKKILIASSFLALNREINGHCALHVYYEMLQIAEPTEEPDLIYYGKKYLRLAYVESVTGELSMVSIANSELLYFLFLHQSLPTLEEMNT